MRNLTGKAGFLLPLVVVGLAVLGVGCSGGGDDDDGAGGLRVTQVTIDPVLATQGVLCVQFTVQGPVQTLVDILAEFTLLGSNEFLTMTEVSPAVQMNLSITSSGRVGLDTGQTGQATFTFYWAAGADLGFASANVQACITPFTNGDPANPNGIGLCSQSFFFDASNPAQNSSGPGSGQTGGNPGGAGRADHDGLHVRSTAAATPSPLENVLVVGGYNDATAPNAFDSADRFEFNQGSAQHNFVSNAKSARRVLHASSFFQEPVTHNIRVLTTGGIDRSNPPPVPPNSDPLVALQNRVSGASEFGTTDVYFLNGGEGVMAGPSMAGPRYAHTATWVPDNRVLIIGGAMGTAGTPTGLDTIEVFDPGDPTAGPPVAPSITPLMNGMSPVVLNQPRVMHTACLLPDGRVLVFGGFDPGSPQTPLDSEIVDPVAGTVSTVPAGTLNTGRIHHTCTRLINGNVLIVGGRDISSGNLLNNAVVYNPRVNPPQNFTSVNLQEARARHEATLLGNGRVLITGGVTPDPTATGTEQFTTSNIVYNPALGSFSPVNPLQVRRADHSSTPSISSSVYVIGGRNGAPSGTNFLDDIEFYAFSNAIPIVATPATSTATAAIMMNVDFEVTDADQDGGYAFLRFRETPGSGPWQKATVDSQITPGNLTLTPPTFEITPGSNTFVWNFTADGVSPSTVVELEIIPVGAVLGTPVQFVAETPQ